MSGKRGRRGGLGRTEEPRGTTTEPPGGKLGLLSAAIGSVIGSARVAAEMVKTN